MSLLLIALVSLGITGSSTGFLSQFFSNESDPALISGNPQAIRSDEWAVQTAWTISQVEQGLPVENATFPGGSDTTVQSDLPSGDWSVAFRPHLLGFFFLPLDNAMALKWWLPGFAMMAASFLFMMTLIPKRPVTASMISVGFFFAPFFQWWFLPITFWPAAWCFLVMAAALWLLRDNRLGPRVTISTAAGYLTVTMGMGVYVPFIVPAVLTAIAIVAGVVLTDSSSPTAGFVGRLKRITPLLWAGLAAVLVLVLWLFTRAETIGRFLATIYPGQRFEETGGLERDGVVALFGAPVTEGLALANGVPLGGNASEASTFFLLGLFLLVPLIGMLVQDWRAGRPTDGVVVAVIALCMTVGAFLIVPGWDWLAHLLLLDRTTSGRVRIALGILSVVTIAIMIARSDDYVARTGRRLPQLGAIGAAFLGALSVVFLLRYLFLRDAGIVSDSWGWQVISVLFVLAIYLFARGLAFWGSISFVVLSLVGSINVNPIYVGVYDLNETKVSQVMQRLDDTKSGAWVGVGESFLPTAVLVHSGLPGYNGFQGAPSPEMWEQIDPEETDEEAWNRLANITWVAGEGGPNPENPAPDQIRMTFDSCSEFAQEQVLYALSDAPLTQDCLAPVATVREGPSQLLIYEVVPRA
ncbi:hypothetical protein [Cryobacterium sp. TMT2-14]|uniref:DUF7657 domain-containing protein n=1 Tax=Cryobacterium sp. TMT2-14 TaxID=1259245 RepID=UPI00106C5F16|nr:hypothetical protein [Cryobacterium sp. TMT2-14]TFC36633.1 hypothetical protein E3O28_07875 [Cryobacterium sp. TMT2-14]